uniref:MANSC domain-containing protein n=1 Tax=Oryzias latipes TaxID=8090 RepID=A0A3B3HV44_ORYLA
MDPLPTRRPTPGLQRLACVLLVMLTSLPASALESETCFSRQHRGATMALQPALNRTSSGGSSPSPVSHVGGTTPSNDVSSLKLTVPAGARCNMVLFNGKKAAGEENCFLFHCDGEQDCPLMKAQDVSMKSGLLTAYYPDGLTPICKNPPEHLELSLKPRVIPSVRHPGSIYFFTSLLPPCGKTSPNRKLKFHFLYRPAGLIHPPTPRPVTMTTVATNTFPLTTTLLLTTKATPTKKPTTVTPTSTTQAPVTTTAPPPVIIATTSTVTAPPATTTKTTTTAASLAPTLTSKRPNKTSRNVSAQPQPSFTTTLPVPTEVTLAAQRTIDTPKLQAGTTTPESTATPSTSIPAKTAAATTTSTTNPPPTTTTTPTSTTTASLSTMGSSTTRATPAAGLIIVPKEAVQANHVLQNSSPAHGKTAVVHGALKSGMVAFMVVALAVVTLALAVGGRKAMESFDRRHYTRLELNDLHYEV